MNKAFKILIKVISVMLTAFIIYGVYNETGPYTAVFCILMWSFTELVSRFMTASNATMLIVSNFVKSFKQQ